MDLPNSRRAFFDELGDLLQLTLTGNDLTELSEGAISAGDTASRSVTASAVASAAHSLAIDSIWDNRSWFEEDDYLGLEFAIGAPLVLANPDEVKVEVPAVYLTQGAQSLDGGVPLVAGRQALLRVFATADADNDFDPRARATFYVGDATVYVDLTPPAVIRVPWTRVGWTGRSPGSCRPRRCNPASRWWSNWTAPT